MNDNRLGLLGRRRLRASTVALATVSLALAGCGTKPTAPAQKLVPLTLTAQSSGVASIHLPASAGTAALSGTVQTVDVNFSKALLVVRDVRFKLSDFAENDSTDDENDSTGTDDASLLTLGSGDMDSTDLDHEDGDGMIVFHGPFVIDLLSQHAEDLDTQMVPPGDYRRVQGHLQALHAGDQAATPDLSFLVGGTVHLAGTIGGEGGGDFTFQARIDDEFMIRGEFAVEADSTDELFRKLKKITHVLEENVPFEIQKTTAARAPKRQPIPA